MRRSRRRRRRWAIHWDSSSNIHHTAQLSTVVTVHSGSYSISHTHIRTLLCGFRSSSATPSSLLLILHKVMRWLHRVRKKQTLNKAQSLKAMLQNTDCTACIGSCWVSLPGHGLIHQPFEPCWVVSAASTVPGARGG